MTKRKLNAQNLTTTLWETLLGVREGKISPEVGSAVANLARAQCRIVQTQVQVAKLNKKNLKTIGFDS